SGRSADCHFGLRTIQMDRALWAFALGRFIRFLFITRPKWSRKVRCLEPASTAERHSSAGAPVAGKIKSVATHGFAAASAAGDIITKKHVVVSINRGQQWQASASGNLEQIKKPGSLITATSTANAI